MMILTHCKNYWVVLLVVAGIFLISAFLFLTPTKAAEEAQIQAAIDDLSSAVGQTITSKDQAVELCNQEQYLDVCADIGKTHDLYTEEEIKQVDGFLSEVKGKILNDIKTCTDEECLFKAANELAQKLKAKNPTLATNLNITAKVIEEKNAVVQAAKEVGVSFRDCEAMDPDTASIDLLRKCAKLAKDIRIQNYIPEEKRVLAAQFEDSATIALREALADGKYQCGDGTLEGCGNFCLNPTQGTGIPAVCSQIASDIFGQEGVKQLEAAYQQVGQVKDYYSNNFILTLPDGSKIIGERQIKARCNQAFSNRNLEIARVCGNFAVKHGFAAQAEVDRGLKLMESFTQKSQNVDFDQCLTNPVACRDFLPVDEVGSFDVGRQIFEIMRTEIGFDPQQCERGIVDEAIGIKCFEGSKRALAKIESSGLAGQSQEARFIIEDIKRHVSEGEGMIQRKDEFKQVFSQQGGPGGCRSEAECFNYCSNPVNGPECISFGAKQGVSGFRGEQAVQRFQEYNQNIQGPYPGYQPPGQIPGFTQPGPGFIPPPGTAPYYPPYPSYPGPGPVGPSPECFAAIQSGDFAKAKVVCSSPTLSVPLPSFPICPLAPYVECPAGQYRESFRNNDGCWVDGPCRPAPTYSPGPYPTGPYPTYTEYPGDANSCPGFAHSKWDKDGKRYCRLNETNSCQYGYPAYLDRANYVPSSCPTEYGGPYPTPTYSPGNWINKTWRFKDGSTQFSSILNRTDSEYTTYINGVYNNCLNKYFAGWKPGGGDANNWQEFGIPVCSDTASTPPPYPTYSPPTGSSCSQSLVNLLGSGCHWMYSDSSGRGIYCDGPMTKSAKEGDTATTSGCSGGGGTYSPYPTVSGGVSSSRGCFYTNATKNGQYPGYTVWCEADYYNCHQGDRSGAVVSLDGLSLGAPSNCESPYPTYSPPTGSSCSQSLVNLLGSGCHWMYSDSSGRGIYCDGPMTKSAKEGDTATTSGCSGGGGTYSPYPTVSGGGTYSPYPTTYGDCRNNTTQSNCSAQLGCQWFTVNGGSFCEGNNYIPTTGTSGSCPSGYHYHGESGGFCMNNQENYGGTCYNASGTSQITCPAQPTYSPYPSYSPTSGGSCPSGSHTMYVNNAGGYCMSDSDGSKCGPLNSTSVSGFGSCSSYQGSTYSPYPTGTYTYTPAPSCPSGQWWDPAISACKSTTPYDTYTPAPSCPSGQWWDYTTSSCKSSSSTGYCGNYVCDSGETSSSCPSDCGGGTTYTPSPTSTYTPYPTYESTYTPYPTTEYTPPPSCPSDQYWDGSSCVSSSPPPTSGLFPHYITAHCQQLGRTWNGKICEANGLFARFYESSGLANILRFLYIVP